MRKEYNDRWNAPLVNPAFSPDSMKKEKQENPYAKPDEVELPGDVYHFDSETGTLHPVPKFRH